MSLVARKMTENLKFGQTSANELRRRRPRCGDAWHLDKVVLTIKVQKHYVWRAVDQHGNVLDILVQSRRNTHAAKRFFRKLLTGLTCAASHYHRQARSLWSSKARASGKRGASPTHIAEQSSGKLAPSNASAREEK